MNFKRMLGLHITSEKATITYNGKDVKELTYPHGYSKHPEVVRTVRSMKLPQIVVDKIITYIDYNIYKKVDLLMVEISKMNRLIMYNRQAYRLVDPYILAMKVIENQMWAE